ncbi:putative DNA-binding protein [Granulicella aggregans]|uniref:Putative DNA-binding protein n=1 Tax=Granulicella aggregans TaxID=474949 RepID=A0A7W7ZBM6_9BACT|nr:putative DNA-binding protein [Granulicella aggregans]
MPSPPQSRALIVYLPAPLKQQLRLLAFETDQPVSLHVRSFIRQGLESLGRTEGASLE